MALVKYRKQTSQTSPDITSAIGEVDADHAAWKAFDGDTSCTASNNYFHFQSSGESTPYWIQIELEEAKAFTRIDAACENSDYFFWDIEILGSNDGTTWDSLYQDNMNNTEACGDWQTYSFTNTTSYKYYRLQTTDPEGNEELEVLEIDMYYESDDLSILHFLDKRYTPYFTNTESFEDKRSVEALHARSFLDKRSVEALHTYSFLDVRDVETGYSVIFSDKRRIGRDMAVSQKFLDVRQVETEPETAIIVRELV